LFSIIIFLVSFHSPISQDSTYDTQQVYANISTGIREVVVRPRHTTKNKRHMKTSSPCVKGHYTRRVIQGDPGTVKGLFTMCRLLGARCTVRRVLYGTHGEKRRRTAGAGDGGADGVGAGFAV
jgi:hypothetical protein